MFGFLDQKTTNYLLAGTGVVVTTTILWKYKSYLTCYLPKLTNRSNTSNSSTQESAKSD